MTNAGESSARGTHRLRVLLWMPVVLGLLALYLPTYRDMASVFWANGLAVHGPLFLAVSTWLIWRERRLLLRRGLQSETSIGGWLFFVLGASFYAIGRSQGFIPLEVASQALLCAGVILILVGGHALRRLWFPLLFMLSIVPVPGTLLDAILIPLKELVSIIVTNALFAAGLPIARDGVLIYAGSYQLLIADACSGLNSMVALTAIGFLYIRLAAYRRWLPNALLLAMILPVAFFANILRVMALVLVTYYGGDAAGQRFHDLAGYTEIAVAFGLFFLIDHMMRRSSDPFRLSVRSAPA
ncbi:MAG: exosortase [Steroidobacteraceae bacterium]